LAPGTMALRVTAVACAVPEIAFVIDDITTASLDVIFTVCAIVLFMQTAVDPVGKGL
jgi:hypothetical protein